jgi:hypothetical protein
MFITKVGKAIKILSLNLEDYRSDEERDEPDNFNLRTHQYPENIDLYQVNDKLYHIELYRVHLVWAKIELDTLVFECWLLSVHM